MDKSYKEKTYVENKFKDGKIDFFIEDLLFRHNKIKMRSDTISIRDFPGIKLLNPEQGVTPADTTFEGLYEQYRQLQGWEHQLMVDHYTEIMQKGIKEVHPL
ncbi:hypothetical protein FHG64_07985 [Antarcticibacterium flavum]|uniref:Uncharacterized protein n=1 Tax=Antarcticibacterium flavum TaxID=2058175 RepID=A0A5B7X1B4_9FLAO|nr:MULTISPECIES: hypothetical protein [Antarcticibacterium]MCM4161929.1 hypothetical protein [Antarcticibacterium sp. W02-3]QCY69336.1 hypothetical protein FHG64_07985 [Antarcticibacterium flavum]